MAAIRLGGQPNLHGVKQLAAIYRLRAARDFPKAIGRHSSLSGRMRFFDIFRKIEYRPKSPVSHPFAFITSSQLGPYTLGNSENFPPFPQSSDNSRVAAVNTFVIAFLNHVFEIETKIK